MFCAGPLGACQIGNQRCLQVGRISRIEEAQHRGRSSTDGSRDRGMHRSALLRFRCQDGAVLREGQVGRDAHPLRDAHRRAAEQERVRAFHPPRARDRLPERYRVELRRGASPRRRRPGRGVTTGGQGGDDDGAQDTPVHDRSPSVASFRRAAFELPCPLTPRRAWRLARRRDRGYVVNSASSRCHVRVVLASWTSPCSC